MVGTRAIGYSCRKHEGGHTPKSLKGSKQGEGEGRQTMNITEKGKSSYYTAPAKTYFSKCQDIKWEKGTGAKRGRKKTSKPGKTGGTKNKIISSLSLPFRSSYGERLVLMVEKRRNEREKRKRGGRVGKKPGRS